MAKSQTLLPRREASLATFLRQFIGDAIALEGLEDLGSALVGPPRGGAEAYLTLCREICDHAANGYGKGLPDVDRRRRIRPTGCPAFNKWIEEIGSHWQESEPPFLPNYVQAQAVDSATDLEPLRRSDAHGRFP